MKQKLGLCGLLAILQGFSPAAPIAIPSGGLTYTQNFNNLATATNNGNSTTPWADDSTIPGWRLYRAGNGTPIGFVGNAYVYRVADGTAGHTVGQFQSMGANGDPDRALGNPSTTGQGELSAIAIFQNTGTGIVELSRVKHNVEILRTNDVANNLETEYVWWRTGSSVADITNITIGPTTSGEFTGSSTTPTSSYITGWNRLTQAEVTYSNAGAAIPVNDVTPVDIVPTTPIRIGPGQFFAIRYSNINDGGGDTLMGIDDVELTFTAPSAAISPVISNVVRNTNGTPTDPSDDTVDFTLTVAGSGNVNPAGWSVVSPFTLQGQTGTYGVAKTFTGISVSDFTGSEHTLDVVVEDQGNPAVSASTVLTAPWCTITPVVTGVTRDGKGTADPFDDEWSYTLTFNAVYGGAEFSSDNSNIPSPGTYGTPYTVTGLPILLGTETTNVTDSADSTCTASVTVSAPRIIGTKNFGTPEPVFSDGSGVPANWTVDESALTQSMNNGGGAPPKVYRSEVIDLSALGGVQFSATLLVNDTSSGHEADDTFNAYLIIDGNAASPVSLIGLYDTDASGVMNGAEITPGPADSDPGTYTHPFNAVIPASANSVQLVVAANNNSTSETMTMQNILFELASHSIVATLAPGVQFTNKGTVNPADDEFRQGINISAVSPPPASTGWTSNSTPAAGLYTDPNPVLFGPFPQSVASRDVVFTDNSVAGVNTTVTVPSPAPALTATFLDSVRNDMGTADPSDDTATVRYQVSSVIGGPSFVLDSSPATITSDITTLTAAPQTVTLTVRDLPTSGNIYFRFVDASYPGSYSNATAAVGTATPTQFVVARKDLGGGISNVLAPTLPAVWINYPSAPALQLNNGNEVVTSEAVDLSGVTGPVNFTANIRVTDLTSGTEAADTLKVELILDGNNAAPVNLVTAYDADSSGAMNGAELAPAAPGGNMVQIFNYPLSYVIPDTVNSVQIVITGANDSTNEIYLVEDALFSIGTPVSDTDGDGQSDASEAVAGTSPTDPNDYLRVTGLTRTANGVDLTFPSKNGRSYQAEVNDDLTGVWTATGSVIVGTGGPVTAPITPVPAPGEEKYFLRIRVVP